MTVLFVRVEAGGEDCNGNQVSNREKDKRKMETEYAGSTEGPLGKKILIFSVPLMLSNLLQVLFNMADIAVIGQFAGSPVAGSSGFHGHVGHHVYRIPHWSVRRYQCTDGTVLRGKG